MKKGDKVKIKNVEECYTTYTEKFKELKFKNPEQSKPSPINFKNKTFTIFVVGKHEEGYALFGIKDDKGNQFLYNKKGIELIDLNTKKDSIKKTKINKILTVLQEAQNAVYGDRQADYGTVTENFNTIAQFWSIILKQKVTAEQVGLCMVTVKIAREMYRSKRDNIVDIAGYAATLEKLSKGE